MKSALTIAVVEEHLELREVLSAMSSNLHLTWLNVSSNNAESHISQSMPIESYGRQLNRLIATVTSDAVLWIDAGWHFVPPTKAFLETCLHMLQVHPMIDQVKLHSEDHLRFTDRSCYSQEPLIGPGDVRFYIQSPRKLGGGLTLAPAITHMRAFRALGPFPEGPALHREHIAAAWCARSTEGERHLAIRSPGLAPFVPKDRPPYHDWDITVELPSGD